MMQTPIDSINVDALSQIGTTIDQSPLRPPTPVADPHRLVQSRSASLIQPSMFAPVSLSSSHASSSTSIAVPSFRIRTRTPMTPMPPAPLARRAYKRKTDPSVAVNQSLQAVAVAKDETDERSGNSMQYIANAINQRPRLHIDCKHDASSLFDPLSSPVMVHSHHWQLWQMRCDYLLKEQRRRLVKFAHRNYALTKTFQSAQMQPVSTFRIVKRRHMSAYASSVQLSLDPFADQSRWLDDSRIDLLSYAVNANASESAASARQAQPPSMSASASTSSPVGSVATSGQDSLAADEETESLNQSLQQEAKFDSLDRSVDELQSSGRSSSHILGSSDRVLQTISEGALLSNEASQPSRVVSPVPSLQDDEVERRIVIPTVTAQLTLELIDGLQPLLLCKVPPAEHHLQLFVSLADMLRLELPAPLGRTVTDKKPVFNFAVPKPLRADSARPRRAATPRAHLPAVAFDASTPYIRCLSDQRKIRLASGDIVLEDTHFAAEGDVAATQSRQRRKRSPEPESEKRRGRPPRSSHSSNSLHTSISNTSLASMHSESEDDLPLVASQTKQAAQLRTYRKDGRAAKSPAKPARKRDKSNQRQPKRLSAMSRSCSTASHDHSSSFESLASNHALPSLHDFIDSVPSSPASLTKASSASATKIYISMSGIRAVPSFSHAPQTNQTAAGSGSGSHVGRPAMPTSQLERHQLAKAVHSVDTDANSQFEAMTMRIARLEQIKAQQLRHSQAADRPM